MSHQHLRRVGFVIAWTECVDPASCSEPLAHGGVVEVSTCACGMERRTESNGRRYVTTAWGPPVATAVKPLKVNSGPVDVYGSCHDFTRRVTA